MKTHLPCLKCGSSDALTDYGDHKYCFSCSTYFKDKVAESYDNYVIEKQELDLTDYKFEYLPWRGITSDSFKFYGVSTKVNSWGAAVAAAAEFRDECARELARRK